MPGEDQSDSDGDGKSPCKQPPKSTRKQKKDATKELSEKLEVVPADSRGSKSAPLSALMKQGRATRSASKNQQQDLERPSQAKSRRKNPAQKKKEEPNKEEVK